MSAKLITAAQAIAAHFKAIEGARGEPIRDTFKNPMQNGALTTNAIGVPVPLLRALIAELDKPQHLTDVQIEAAKAAISTVLRRIQRTPRIAYYFDPLTDSFEKLTAAHAALHGLDVTKVRADMAAVMTYEAPQALLT